MINEFKELVIKDWVKDEEVRQANETIFISTKANYVIFMCPCGCGAKEAIQQDSGTQIPNVKWKFTIEDKKVTIHPSMYMRECKTNSHYWLRDSKVLWV